MSFRERTAWIMASILAAAGAFYSWEVIGAGLALDAAPPPSIKLAAVYIAIVIGGAIVGSTAAAIDSPEDTEEPVDERERLVIDKAGNWSGYVLAAPVVIGALHYWSHQDGNMMFHIVVFGLMLSQLADYVFQIILYRRGV